MKDKIWLKEEVNKTLRDKVSDGINYYDYMDLKNSLNELINQLDEPEILSQEWISKFTSPVDDEGRLYVWKSDLQNLLVPKQDKPGIPQFVAEWIEESRESGFTLFGVFHFSEGKVNSWIYEGGYKDERANIVARAWLDGYEVEKEKKYLVKLPHESDMGLSLYLSRQFGVEWVDEETMADHITEAEIKAIDERYWAFAEEVRE